MYNGMNRIGSLALLSRCKEASNLNMWGMFRLQAHSPWWWAERCIKHYLHRSCCQQPGGGQGDTDSTLLPLSPSGNQTGISGRNMRPLLEDRQGNPGWGSVREMRSWIATEDTQIHTHWHTTTHSTWLQYLQKKWSQLVKTKQKWWPNTLL